jgi:hypothetical protein
MIYKELETFSLVECQIPISRTVRKHEVFVVKKMSMNLDIFFYRNLLKSILNPLMLILGHLNLMKI